MLMIVFIYQTLIRRNLKPEEIGNIAIILLSQIVNERWIPILQNVKLVMNLFLVPNFVMQFL